MVGKTIEDADWSQCERATHLLHLVFLLFLVLLFFLIVLIFVHHVVMNKLPFALALVSGRHGAGVVAVGRGRAAHSTSETRRVVSARDVTYEGVVASVDILLTTRDVCGGKTENERRGGASRWWFQEKWPNASRVA